MYVYALKTDEVAILDLLRGMIKKFGKKYCYPSHATICRLLEKFHCIRMSERTLCRRLAKLQKLGLIRRIRRLSQSAWTSTAYYVCERVGVSSGRIKKILGYSKRLGPFYPTTKSRFVDGGPKEPPAVPVETLRCETSDRMKDSSAPGPCEGPKEGKEPQNGGAVRACMDLVRSLNRSRLLKRGS